MFFSQRIFGYLLLALAPVTRAEVTYTAGDLLLGFQASAGTGAGSNYVFNLGQGHSFRSAAGAIEAGNLATDLANTFGSDWFIRDDLRCAIAGVRTNASFGPDATTVIEGDPARTLYVSRGTAAPGGSTPGTALAASTVGTGATRMIDMQNGFRTTNGTIQRVPTPASGGRGVLQGIGDINSWSSRVDATPFTIFTSNIKQTFGPDKTAAYLDLYRILAINTLPGTVETATVGLPVLQGTFAITSDGKVTFQPPGTATNPYDLWAEANGLTATQRAFALDPDADGWMNGLEFVLGGNPLTGPDPDKLPVLTVGSTGPEYTFPRASVAAQLNLQTESSPDLESWSPVTDGSGGAVITTEKDAMGTGIDRITVRLANPTTRRFLRLKVQP